jgi:hypothetical protein
MAETKKATLDQQQRHKRWTVCVDFDGVIHSYTSGWNEGWQIDPCRLLDPPVPGAIEWLEKIALDFEVVILTTRGQFPESEAAVKTWLLYHGLSEQVTERIIVTHEKVAALVYIDDRGYRFTGDNFPTASEIHRLRPWNKPPTKDKEAG